MLTLNQDVLAGALAQWCSSLCQHSKGKSVKFIRQVLLAISIAGMVAGVLRRRTKGVVAPQQGGWREVTPQR